MHNLPESALFVQPENGQGKFAACCCFREGITCVSADGNLRILGKQGCTLASLAQTHRHTSSRSRCSSHDVMVANVKSQHSHHVNLKHDDQAAKLSLFVGIAKIQMISVRDYQGTIKCHILLCKCASCFCTQIEHSVQCTYCVATT